MRGGNGHLAWSWQRSWKRSGTHDIPVAEGRSGPSLYPVHLAPHPLPCARLSLGLSCFTSYLSFLTPAGGTGEEAPVGSMEEPGSGRRMEITPPHSDVPCDCLGVEWAP